MAHKNFLEAHHSLQMTVNCLIPATCSAPSQSTLVDHCLRNQLQEHWYSHGWALLFLLHWLVLWWYAYCLAGSMLQNKNCCYYCCVFFLNVFPMRASVWRCVVALLQFKHVFIVEVHSPYLHMWVWAAFWALQVHIRFWAVGGVTAVNDIPSVAIADFHILVPAQIVRRY